MLEPLPRTFMRSMFNLQYYKREGGEKEGRRVGEQKREGRKKGGRVQIYCSAYIYIILD